MLVFKVTTLNNIPKALDIIRLEGERVLATKQDRGIEAMTADTLTYLLGSDLDCLQSRLVSVNTSGE
ncbi:MAG: hypothetical protein ABSD85_16535 [Acidimicrobiales bacterium]